MPSLRFALIVLSVMNSAAIVFAQEPEPRDRPERFLMLLRPGDKLSWSVSTRLNGYRLGVYSQSRFAEIVKDRTARQVEIKTLDKEVDGRRSISFSDTQSKDPETQRFVQNSQRLDRLRSVEMAAPKLGTVTFVGQDYIAVVAHDDESQELLIPAWNIVQIGRSKETK